MRPQGSRCLVPSAQRQTHQEEGRLVTRGRWGQRGHLCAMWAGAQGPTSGQVDGRAAGGEALLPAQRGHCSPQASQRRRCLASRLAGRAVHTWMPWLCPAPQAALAIRRPRSCSLGTFPVGRSCAKPTPSMSGRQRRACAGAEPSGASLHLHLTRACLACCWSHCEHRALGPRGAWPLGLACRVGKVQGAETKQLMRPWEAWLPASWASFTQGHLGPGQGGLLSRAAACWWHGPAVGRACLGPAGPRSRKGPSLGGSSLGPACPPPSALTGPGQPVCGQQAQGGSEADWLWLWPQPLLCEATGSSALPWLREGLGWRSDPGQWGPRSKQGSLATSWPVPRDGGLSFRCVPTLEGGHSEGPAGGPRRPRHLSGQDWRWWTQAGGEVGGPVAGRASLGMVSLSPILLQMLTACTWSKEMQTAKASYSIMILCFLF